MVLFVALFNQMTPRAKLGRMANRYVRKGQAIKDELLVEIMVEAVK